MIDVMLDKTWKRVSAIAGLVAVFYGLGSWVGWPPYAARAEVDRLATEIRANSIASLYIQLENAIRSGDRTAILRLCWAIQKETGQKPAGCP